MEICTIGFTKHSAQNFFETLRDERVTRLVDVRLNNASQLAGFAKRDDLHCRSRCLPPSQFSSSYGPGMTS